MHNKRQKRLWVPVAFFLCFVISCTLWTAGFADPPRHADTQDPYEHFNRAMFIFNDQVDTFLLKPIAIFYNKVIPKPIQQGVHNFFINIGELPIMANDILQFQFYQLANDFWRFSINSTVGIAGLFDIASRIHLPYYQNDFGLTLANWGFEHSNYLVLPFFGPNTVRDGIGIPVDYYAFSIYPRITPRTTRYALYGLGVIDRRVALLQYQDVMEEAALDKYVFVRNAYMQRRLHQLKENQHRGYRDQYDALSENVAFHPSMNH